MFTTQNPHQSLKLLNWRKARFVPLPEASEPIDQAAQEDEAIPQDELDDKTAGEVGVHEYVVSTGDTLSSILNQYGIDMSDISRLAASDKELRNLKIGQQLSWTLTADGDLQRLTWEVSAVKRVPTIALPTVLK